MDLIWLYLVWCAIGAIVGVLLLLTYVLEHWRPQIHKQRRKKK